MRSMKWRRSAPIPKRVRPLCRKNRNPRFGLFSFTRRREDAKKKARAVRLLFHAGVTFRRNAGQRKPLRGRHNFFAPSRLRVKFRSEEHTSELQSLMRISYAVFCLTKKKKII